MHRFKLSAVLPGFCLLVLFCQDLADAQVPRLRIQNNNRTYNIRIVSNFGQPVRVGIFGYSERATFRVSFDGGATGPDVYNQELIGGDRVVIVWDTNGRRLLVADLTVDSDGTLPLGPPMAAFGANPGARGAQGARGNDIPRLRINQ